MALVLVGSVAADRAVAGTEHYCEGNTVPARSVCAGGNAHGGTVYVQVQLNHTGCAGLAYGFGGWQYGTLANTESWACTSGAGTNGTYVTICCSLAGHGAVINENQSTQDYVYEAHISW